MAPRATWVWEQPDPEALLAWVRAEHVREVFLGVGTCVADPDQGMWAHLVVELMHRHGVRVTALGGDVGWLKDTQSAITWQRAVAGTRLFDGIHLDVEVWTHPEWTTRPRPLGAAYVFLLQTLAKDSALPIEADVAFHLHKVPGDSGETLEAEVMEVLDAVTVLSYRNTVTGPDSITDVAASALASAAKAGIPCRLAVETQYLGPDLVSRKQTFHGLGKAALDHALGEVDQILVNDPAYAGMGVHDYEHWRAL
jgi:hypothetical protein